MVESDLKTKRTAIEVKARCSSIINDSQIVFWVSESFSPTAAFEIVIANTGDLMKAKAARWLAILRRDYPNIYADTVRQ